MEIRLAREMIYDSIVDGEGLRTVIWTQGCSHHCENCHNPETHDFKKGFLIETEEVNKQILKRMDQDGITLSGGDPFFQPEACYEIAKFAKKQGMNIWSYTGFTFERLCEMAYNNQAIKNLLSQIDVLVDGKFLQKQKSLNLYFKGSKNQRILDLPKSLQEGKAIEIEKYKGEKDFCKGYVRQTEGIYV